MRRITIGPYVLTLLTLVSLPGTPAHARQQPTLMETAETPTGAIDGLVYAPDGKLVPNVFVMAEDETTGRAWESRTDKRGYFMLVSLPPGSYCVRVDMPPLSFLTTGVIVAAGKRQSVDVTLVVSREEIVKVESRSATAAAFTSTGTAAVFNRASIDAAPLANGRTLQSLLAPVPGVVITESSGTLAQYTAAGQNRFANRLSIDNIDANLAIGVGSRGLGQGGNGTLPAMTTSGGTQTLVTLDSIGEIEVRTVNASPRHAQTPGAQISIVTRSGGDRSTGSVFADARPSKLMASDWFANAATIPPRRATAFGTGVEASGPIVRSRLFFAGSFERQRIDRAIAATIPVPSLAAREAASRPLRAVLDAYPAPNGGSLSSDLAALSLELPVTSGVNAYSLRLDTGRMNGHQVFTRFHRATSEGDELTDDKARMPAAAYSLASSTLTTSVTAGWNSVFRGSAVNDLRANVTHHAAGVFAGPAARHDPVLPFDLLLPPDVPRQDALVTLTLYPGPGGTIVSGRTTGGAHRQFQVANTFTYARGPHEILLGADVRRLSSSTNSARVSYGYRAAGIEEFLTSGISVVSIAQRLPARILRYSVAMFVQDDWRIAPRLTLTYGIRYNVRPPPVSATAVEPLLLQFDALPEFQPRPSGARLWRTSWQDLNPHLFAAYSLGTTPGRQTMLRAGISIVSDDLLGPAATAFVRAYPFAWQRVVLNAPFPPRPGDLSAVTPKPFGPSARAEAFALSDSLRTPYAYQWQFSIEQQLGRGRHVALAYVGTAGRRLVYWQAYQPAGYPTWMIHAFDNNGRSDYHALITESVVKVSGVTAKISHTWSHAIDIDSGEEPGPHPPVTLFSPATNRGNADFDRRHVLRAQASMHLPALPLPAWLRPLGGKWDLVLTGTAQSGAPVSVTVTPDLPGMYVVRPDAVPGEPLWIADPNSPTGRRINSDAFVFPIDRRSGTVGRNTLRGSPLRQLDLAISRSVTLPRGASLKVRVQAFNILNIPNFGPPDGNYGSVSFGLPISSQADALGTGTLMRGGLAPIQQTGGQRSIQVVIRASF